jgi:FADH2 O2-dependent halogenase
LSAFGTWQRTYPQVVCGLKRGFTYFKHEGGQRYRATPDRSNQLLVAASPSDEVSDTHWLRSDVDHFLVNEAIAHGVEYVDLAHLDGIEWRSNGDPVLVGNRQGHGFRLHAHFVIDASGPRGFLSRALGIADRGFDGYPLTQALFSHFTDVARCGELEDFDAGVAPSELPYPMDDAALHHVFDGGWMWVLRFGNGVTSAGVAVEDWLADDLKLAEGEPAWHRFLARYPSVAAQFADARPTRAFTCMPRLACRAVEASGERWAMLPSAAAFIDPLFSTGIPLTLLGIERLARIFAEDGVRAGKSRLDDYGAATLADADRTAGFIAGSYAGFQDFPLFCAYSMFYFAAASFSEMARRLGSVRTPRGFLCGDSPAFVSALQALSPAHRTAVHDSLPDIRGYEDEIAAAVADWNVAGLCDRRKRHWYGVDLDDTVRAASRLALTPDEVRTALMPVSSSPSARE